MNKKALIKAIKREMGSKASYYDIFSVVNILLDELTEEIWKKKQVVIPNFGKFKLKVFNPKIIKNVRNGARHLTKPYTALRFKLAPNFIKFLTKTENGK